MGRNIIEPLTGIGMMSINSQNIIDFWFHELTPKQWWGGDYELDRLIEKRFGQLHKAATLGELWDWRDNSIGALAEIIVLDQFSRNIFRGTAQSFATDGISLALAQNSITQGYDKELEINMRSFMYMPFMHSESVKIQEKAISLFSFIESPESLDFAMQHKAIIDRFGRFPHRNHILGRISTPEELEFLQGANSGF